MLLYASWLTIKIYYNKRDIDLLSGTVKNMV